MVLKQKVEKTRCATFKSRTPGTGPKKGDYGLAPCEPVDPPSSPVLPHPGPETGLVEDTLVWSTQQVIWDKNYV